jgi:hypothetical protein
MITLENKKLHDYIVLKDNLVSDGRKIQGNLNRIEDKIKKYEEKEKAITAKTVPPQELIERGDALVKKVTELDAELAKIVKEINDFKLAAIPSDIKEEHQALLKEREALERDRNKVALKVQKIKDKVVPLIQKEVKPLLKDPYDDIETAKTKDGKVIISTYNRLEDWKKTFRG